MIKAEEVMEPEVLLWFLGEKDAPCLSFRNKRLKSKMKAALRGGACPCSSEGRERTHHSSAVPLATAPPAQHLNMRTLVLVPPIHPPFPHSTPLSSGVLFPPHSRNPPTPTPSSAPPRLIPILQRLVINVSFNCHAHFYAH